MRPCDNANLNIESKSCADQSKIDKTLFEFFGMSSHVEYDPSEGQIQAFFTADHASTIPIPLDSGMTKVYDVFIG